MKSMKLWQSLSGAVLVLALTGCDSLSQSAHREQGAGALAVTGSVFYRDRMALPDNAVVTVTLADISKQDIAANVLSEVKFPAAGKQIPFNFSLPYAKGQVPTNGTVSVFARIEVDGQLLYTSTSVNEVINNGKNSIDIQLDRASISPL